MEMLWEHLGTLSAIWQHLGAVGEPLAGRTTIPLSENVLGNSKLGRLGICPQPPSQALAGAVRAPAGFCSLLHLTVSKSHNFGYKPPHTPRAPSPFAGSFPLRTAVGSIQAPTSSCVACSPPLSHWPPTLSTEDSSSHLPWKGFPRSSATLSLGAQLWPRARKGHRFHFTHGPSPLGLVP